MFQIKDLEDKFRENLVEPMQLMEVIGAKITRTKQKKRKNQKMLIRKQSRAKKKKSTRGDGEEVSNTKTLNVKVEESKAWARSMTH